MRCKICKSRLVKPACIVMHIEPPANNSHVEIFNFCEVCKWQFHDAIKAAKLKGQSKK